MSERLPRQRPLPGKEAMMSEIFDSVDRTTARRRGRNTWLAAAAGVAILGIGIGVGYLAPWTQTVQPPATTPSPTVTSSETPSPSPSVTPVTTPAATTPPSGQSVPAKWASAKVGLDLGGVFSINGELSARDRDEAWLVSQLGQPQQRTTQATCTAPDSSSAANLRNTVLRWGDLRVTITNQVIPGPGADFPAGTVMGWQLDSRLDGAAGAAPDGRFDNGIGVGSTLAQLKAAFSDGSSSGTRFSVFRGDMSNLEASLANGKVVALHAGRVCVPAR